MSKIEKIKAEIDRLQYSMLDEDSNFKSQYDQGIFDGLSLIDNFIDSLEQPIKRTSADIEAAMQEVEEKSKLFTEAHKDDVVSNDTLKVISNDLEKEIQRYYNEMDGDCRYMQTARHFARWKKEQMVEEACKWLELHDSYAVPTNIKVRDLKEHLSSK